MITITSFDRNQVPQVTLIIERPDDAAKAAISLSAKAAFTRVADGEWAIVFARACRASTVRLAHIIEHHANVTL